MGLKLTGSFAGNGDSAIVSVRGDFIFRFVFGGAVATLTLNRKASNGTYAPVTKPDLTPAVFTADTGWISGREVTEAGADFKITCSGYASGAPAYELRQ